jgi:CheY-like chemotaxis protein
MEDAAAAEAPTTPQQTSPGGGGEWEPTHTLLVTVTDGGRGLSAEQCGRIFNAYECAPASQGGGHGLGLYIARACARRSGGDISVRSAPGLGSAFTLAFPVELAPAEDAPPRETPSAPESPPKRARSPEESAPVPEPVPAPPAKRTSGAIAPVADDGGAPVLRVCLADDNRLNLRLLSRLLATAGFGHVTACDDGAEALAALTGGATYHLAVLDMCMPTPGPAVARALRAWEAENGAPQLPVYCLTANVLAEHRAECEDAGFDGFITSACLSELLTLPASRFSRVFCCASAEPLRQENLAELRERARAYAAA